jgi:hypothetical protein
VHTRITSDNSKDFEALIINRNISPKECSLKVSLDLKRNLMHTVNSSMGITCEINIDGQQEQLVFGLEWDDFSMFWVRAGQLGMRMQSFEEKKYNHKEIADDIWIMWLEKVGITI